VDYIVEVAPPKVGGADARFFECEPVQEAIAKVVEAGAEFDLAKKTPPLTTEGLEALLSHLRPDEALPVGEWAKASGYTKTYLGKYAPALKREGLVVEERPTEKTKAYRRCADPADFDRRYVRTEGGVEEVLA
jgi:hypothetical protein